MKSLGWFLIVAAAATSLQAVKFLLFSPNRPQEPDKFVGYVMGVFSVPLLFLIVGVGLGGEKG